MAQVRAVQAQVRITTISLGAQLVVSITANDSGTDNIVATPIRSVETFVLIPRCTALGMYASIHVKAIRTQVGNENISVVAAP